MTKWLLCTIAVLFALLIGLMQRANKLSAELNQAQVNLKAYNQELSDTKGTVIAHQFTIDQLHASQDSVLQRLEETRKELKVKDSKLKAMQYSASSFTKLDTVVLKDTIFKKTFAAVDTVIGDNWYNIKLGLKYPSTILVKPTFNSEKHFVVSNKRVTVNSPKKFFLFRWFQKKQTIVTVDVVEKNPYVTNEKNRYVEIIK